jgi:hypothetical protein
LRLVTWTILAVTWTLAAINWCCDPNEKVPTLRRFGYTDHTMAMATRRCGVVRGLRREWRRDAAAMNECETR